MKGIYCITNKINGKKYIGQAVNINKRCKEHTKELKGNYHSNQHLQSAFNKYGESAFEFTVLEQCKEQELNDKEIYYIAKYKAYNPQYGYNKTYGGEGGRHTEETKQKMSITKKGKIFTEEHKLKLSESSKNRPSNRLGQVHTEETKNKMRLSHKGKPKLGTSINNGQRKLTDQDVLDIVKLNILEGVSMYKLAKIYNISTTSIQNIIKGKTYKRLTKEIESILVQKTLI